MNIPQDARYTDQHQWVRMAGDVAVIGITDFAQDQLGGIVMVELPKVGVVLAQGQQIGVVESTKAVSVGEIAEHIVYGRALWLAREVNDTSAELAPLLRWDAPDDPPHSAAEITAALDLTWQRFNALMQRWAAYGDDFPAAEAETLGALWGMLDHDLPHIGELAYQMGALGLDAPGI